VGVDNIDLDAATERGIVVVNTPGGNTIATAELTFTHLLCAARPIAQADRSMKQGGWDRKTLGGVELMGKTLAVLGLGRIGSEVAHRGQAFGMTVIAYDPFLTDSRAKALNVEKVELEAVWERADYITVHMPLTEKTRNLINGKAISLMKKGFAWSTAQGAGSLKKAH
jgi:D-3-phosphoglycerate dehydrogenase / 2-oxoglutarate reductase